MNMMKTRFILLAAVLSSILAVSACQPSQARVDELEAENQSLAQMLTELEEQIADLEAELQQMSEQNVVSRAPHEGWEEYFTGFDQTTLLGETTETIAELLGKPPFVIRSIAVIPEFSREIWVFTPYQDDPTGLYLFFKDSKLTDSRLDEFQGLHKSGLLDEDDFWQ